MCGLFEKRMQERHLRVRRGLFLKCRTGVPKLKGAVFISIQKARTVEAIATELVLEVHEEVP
jgi:hypothetical protein